MIAVSQITECESIENLSLLKSPAPEGNKEAVWGYKILSKIICFSCSKQINTAATPFLNYSVFSSLADFFGCSSSWNSASQKSFALPITIKLLFCLVKWPNLIQVYASE